MTTVIKCSSLSREEVSLIFEGFTVSCLSTERTGRKQDSKEWRLHAEETAFDLTVFMLYRLLLAFFPLQNESDTCRGDTSQGGKKASKTLYFPVTAEKEKEIEKDILDIPVMFLPLILLRITFMQNTKKITVSLTLD